MNSSSTSSHKPRILLLHGALASKQQMMPLQILLENKFDCISIDLPGHGTHSASAANFDMPSIADALVLFLEKESTDPVAVFGYSMGGYAALMAALRRPDLFSCVVTLGTKFDWTPDSANAEIIMLDTAKMSQKIPKFVAQLATIHGDDLWKNVVDSTAAMMISLGNNPLLTKDGLQSLSVPALFLVGENDLTAGVASTAEYARAANAQHHVIAAAGHPFDKMDQAVLAHVLIEFFSAAV